MTDEKESIQYPFTLKFHPCSDGRERTQEEFFHTFNSLHNDRHQIVLTVDKVPRDIPDLENRLRIASSRG